MVWDGAALELQAGREDPLYDAALQIGGEAIPVLEDHELADAFLQSRVRVLRMPDPVP